MMILVGLLEPTGFFQYLAVLAAKISKGKPVRLLILLGAITSIVSMVLDNVTTVVLIAPVTILICEILGFNTQPFLISETIPPGNNSLIKTYSLNGYAVDLTAGGNAQFNTLMQNYTVSVSNSANPAEISFGKGAIAELSYSQIIPQYAKGYFGQQDIVLDVDTATFEVFKNEIPCGLND
jgi:hypothetical protein